MLQAIPASRAGARLSAAVLHHLDRLLMRLSGGRLSAPALLVGLPTVMLTTTGARSGRPRTVPLLGIPDGDEFILVASNWGQAHYPAWCYNLRANPAAQLLANGRSGAYQAREVGAAEYERYWQRVTALYRGFPEYRRRTDASGRQIPIFVLAPVAGQP
jgi:deazaflavin-dependent oxidoreductase (nitroreductase family)